MTNSEGASHHYHRDPAAGKPMLRRRCTFGDGSCSFVDWVSIEMLVTSLGSVGGRNGLDSSLAWNSTTDLHSTAQRCVIAGKACPIKCCLVWSFCPSISLQREYIALLCVWLVHSVMNHCRMSSHMFRFCLYPIPHELPPRLIQPNKWR